MPYNLRSAHARQSLNGTGPLLKAEIYEKKQVAGQGGGRKWSTGYVQCTCVQLGENRGWAGQVGGGGGLPAGSTVQRHGVGVRGTWRGGTSCLPIHPHPSTSQTPPA